MKLSSSIVLRPIAPVCYLLNTDEGYKVDRDLPLSTKEQVYSMQAAE